MEYVQTYFMALAALFLGFFSGIFGSSEQQAVTEAGTSQRQGYLPSSNVSNDEAATPYKVSFVS